MISILRCENNSETVFATFCRYDHGAKASEAVKKIATDHEKYMLLIFYNLLNSQKIYLSINSSKKRLVTRTTSTQVAKIKKLQKLHRKNAITGPWRVLSVMEVR